MQIETESVQIDDFHSATRLDLLPMDSRRKVQFFDATSKVLRTQSDYKDKKFRVLLLEFYEDSTPDNVLSDWLDSMMECTDGVWAAVHDKDCKFDGSPKKRHIHVVIYIKGSPRTWSAWGKWIREHDCPLSRYAYAVSDNLRRSIRYLLHRDSKSKYQYDFSALLPGLSSHVEYLPFVSTQSDSRSELRIFLDDLQLHEFPSLTDVMDFYADSFMAAWCMRNYGLIQRLVTESINFRAGHGFSREEMSTILFLRNLGSTFDHEQFRSWAALQVNKNPGISPDSSFNAPSLDFIGPRYIPETLRLQS